MLCLLQLCREAVNLILILLCELLELLLVEGVLELGDRRGDLEALEQDALLALHTDVRGPLGEA